MGREGTTDSGAHGHPNVVRLARIVGSPRAIQGAPFRDASYYVPALDKNR